MPPKKNGFMVFTEEWKGKYGRNMSLDDAVSGAGKVWAEMSPQQRGPYKATAKAQNIDDRKERVLLNCYGIPVKQVKNEERERAQKELDMKNAIVDVIELAVKRRELKEVRFNFIMFNYFSKTQDELFLPAEMAICEYTLVGGMTSIYSTVINPDVTIYGSQYEAQSHAESTHMLPLPPNALGNKNLSDIYKNIVKFLRKKGKALEGQLPPVYTFNEHMAIVQSCLTYLNRQAPDEPGLVVFNLHYMFYQLKRKCCELADVEPPHSTFITDEYFNRDAYEYEGGIGCKYHEELDRSKYCAKSRVRRWCYYFSDYICPHLNIKLLPGKHVPPDVCTSDCNTAIDANIESMVNNELSVSSAPLGNSFNSWTPQYNDESVFSGNLKDSCDFPSLSGVKKKNKKPSNATHNAGNPWKLPAKSTPTSSEVNLEEELSAQMERIEFTEPPQAKAPENVKGKRRSAHKRTV